MAVTIVQNSQPRQKNGATIALVLSGGAISGGAFKVGGLIAFDLLFVNTSVMASNMYIGVSAGSFLAAQLAAGISPQELLHGFAGRSRRLRNFGALEFYWPNFTEVAEKVGEAAHELAVLYPRAAWAAARLLSRGGTLAAAALKRSLRKGKHGVSLDQLSQPLSELSALAEQLPSAAAFIPSGVFDNRRVGSYVRDNLARVRIPNNFSLLQRETGKRLYVHAVDLDTAQDVIFGPDERSDVTISEAVQASTALPGFYRPARINGRYYIDGNARKTAPIELAMAKGADLILCYNPFRPFNNVPNRSLSAKYASLGDMGLATVIDQSIRTLLHSRLSIAVSELGKDPSFTGDLIVLEPAESDREFFSINPLSFWQRAQAARHGFMTVARDVERNFVRLKEILRGYGIEVDLSRLENVSEKLETASSEAEILRALSSPPLPRGAR